MDLAVHASRTRESFRPEGPFRREFSLTPPGSPALKCGCPARSHPSDDSPWTRTRRFLKELSSWSPWSSQSESQIAFEPARNQCGWRRIRVHPQVFQCGGQAAPRYAAIKRGNHSHLGIRERRDNFVEIIGFHAHVAVAHDDGIVPGSLNRLAEVVDFVVRTQVGRRRNQAD